MFSSKLPNPLDIKGITDIHEADQYLYNYFRETYMDKEKRPKLFGKFIYISFNEWIDKKSSIFWHLSSLNTSERFDIYPCNNCISASVCPTNCTAPIRTIRFRTGETRNYCLYRAMRMNWIAEIIRLANNEDPSVTVWKKDIEIKNQMRTQLFVRFKHEVADYVLVFEEKYNVRTSEVKNYYFVSAFPVFYIRTKKKYDQEHLEYIESLSKA